MTTLSALRAAYPVTRALEDCPICSRIPEHCSRFVKGGDTERDDIPPEVSQLVDVTELPARRCPTCSRLYLYDSEYEFIYGGSEDSESYDRVTYEELLHHETMLPYRVGDDRLCGHLGESRKVVRTYAPQWFAHHVVVDLAADGTTLHVAFPDDGAAFVLSLDAVARMVAAAPIDKLDERKRLLAYAEHVDKLTSEYRHGFLRVDAFEAIPWRAELTGDDRLAIEDLRRASRVKPLRVVEQASAWELHFWVVAHQKLICRVLTVTRAGAVTREDAIIGENLPVPIGTRWTWDHATQRSIPVD